MAEPEQNLGEPSPDEFYNEGIETGYDIGHQESLEQAEDLLYEAGFDEDEIEEALYDPAPRRGRSRRRRHSRRSSRRSYDPAPRRRRRGGRRSRTKVGRKGRSRKGKLAKFRKFVLPAATIGSFYMSYSANAQARGLNLIDALKQDLSTWSAQKTMDKISADPLPAVGTIGIPFAKKMIPGANSGVIGLAVDAIQGILTGQFLTQVVDEPAPARQAPITITNGRSAHVQVLPAGASSPSTGHYQL